MGKKIFFLLIFIMTYEKIYPINGTISGDTSISYEAFDPRVKTTVTNKNYQIKLKIPKKQLVDIDVTALQIDQNNKVSRKSIKYNDLGKGDYSFIKFDTQKVLNLKDGRAILEPGEYTVDFQVNYDKKNTPLLGKSFEIGIIFRGLKPSLTKSTILGKPVYAHGGYRHPIYIKQPKYKGNLLAALDAGKLSLIKQSDKSLDCKNPKSTNSGCFTHLELDIKNTADAVAVFRPYFKIKKRKKEIYRDYLMPERVSIATYLFGLRQEISRVFFGKPSVTIYPDRSLKLSSSPLSIPLEKGDYSVEIFYSMKDKIPVQKTLTIKETYTSKPISLGKVVALGKENKIAISSKKCKMKKSLQKYECRFKANLVSYFSKAVTAKVDSSDNELKFKGRNKRAMKFSSNIATSKPTKNEIKGRIYVKNQTDILKKDLKLTIKSMDGYLNTTNTIPFTLVN